jgi:hypothetical protein
MTLTRRQQGANDTDPRPRPRPRPRALRLLAAAVPFVWAPFVMMHPTTTPYAGIADNASPWLTVHVAQLALAPLLAMALWSVVGGLAGPAATVARVALALWVALFSAFDAIAGIATGRLTAYANSLEGEARTAVGEAITHLFEHDAFIGGGFSVLSLLAQPLWLVVAASAALALRHAGERHSTVAAMWLGVLFAAHGGPVAAFGLVSMSWAIYAVAPERPAGGGVHRGSGRPARVRKHHQRLDLHPPTMPRPVSLPGSAVPAS